jgi:hypothetical protein
VTARLPGEGGVATARHPERPEHPEPHPTGSRPPGGSGDLLVAGPFLAAALVVAPLLGLAPRMGILAFGGLLVVLVAALRPTAATIVLIAVNPLLVGVERGSVVPSLRLNEAAAAPVMCGLAVALLIRWRRSGWRRPEGFHALDVVVVALAVTASVTTLLWMYARGHEITTDDLQYALVLWKLVLFYAMVRLFIRTAQDIRHLLWAVLGTALLIGGIGLLQSLGIGPVIDFLAGVIPPEEGGYGLGENRATATFGNPIAYGALMIYAGVAALALALRDGGSTLLWAAAAALTLCGLASGQISILLGLVVAGGALAVTTGAARRVVLGGLALLGVGLLALQPVLKGRISDLDPQTGLPTSWTGDYGRMANLQTYFLPELWTDFNWLFGVQPAARVPGKEAWLVWVYIESGYVWLLWVGGIPLLIAFLALILVTARTGRRLRSAGEPVSRAMGLTLGVIAAVLAVLTLLDPHITLRGSADLLFVLLAVAATLDAGRRADRTAGRGGAG